MVALGASQGPLPAFCGATAKAVATLVGVYWDLPSLPRIRWTCGLGCIRAGRHDTHAQAADGGGAGAEWVQMRGANQVGKAWLVRHGLKDGLVCWWWSLGTCRFPSLSFLLLLCLEPCIYRMDFFLVFARSIVLTLKRAFLFFSSIRSSWKHHMVRKKTDPKSTMTDPTSTMDNEHVKSPWTETLVHHGPCACPLPASPCGSLHPRTRTTSNSLFGRILKFVLTLFIFKAPNYMLARTLTEREV